MEKQVIFRDYQEQTAQDHNDLQDYGRDSLEHLVLDAITASRRYAGFNTQKTAQTEIQTAPGRFYDVLGVVYSRSTTLTQSMVTYLPAVASRIVALTVYGTETETDVKERDFLVDVDTGRTEPDAVAMTRSRDAVLAFVAGSESADPQPPAIPVTSVAIAYIRLDPTQVVSVTMLTDNAVESTESLDDRADALETFKNQIGPRVDSLASDLAALAEALKARASNFDMSQIYQDLARLKERAEIPDTAVAYGADRFLDETESDADNSASLGYDCLVQEGIRFAFANQDVFEPSIFSANDPNAKLTSGLLLPAYDNLLKIEVGTHHSDIGIAQYGFQTHDIVQKQIARHRLRYGDWFTVCTNAQWWRSGAYDQVTRTFLKDGETYEVVNTENANIEYGGLTHFIRLRQIWRDDWVENYWEIITTDHQISGAQVAQTLLIPNDMWLTKLGFYLAVKAANEAVYITVCQLTAGVPDLSRAVLHQQIPHTSLSIGWTEVDVMPTFLKGGERYAVVMTANANHQIGMAQGQTYLDGTFFYSTDGAFFLGDLTKDIMLRLYGARFRAPQVTIELAALNLDGGIRDVDILAGMINPDSTQLIFEVQPGGSGAWIPLDETNLAAFSATPPLARFRARFVGTRDMHAGLMLTGSQVTLFRPKVSFKHVSDEIDLGSAQTTINVKLMLEDFDDTPHDCSAFLAYGTVTSYGPTSTSTKLISAADKRYERTFRFVGTTLQTFRLVTTGTTNSASNVFHVAERVHWVGAAFGA